MSNMQVILLRDIASLGKMGDVVNCKRGYIRNHLLPNKLVQQYSPEAVEIFEKQKSQLIKEQNKAIALLKDLHGKLDSYILQTVVQAQEDGSMYGSITKSSVVDLLKEQNIAIKRNQVGLPNNEPIKQIGNYDVTITIDDGLVATVKLSITSESN